MIRIKKLSTKLLIGLSAMMLCLIIWQAVFTKRVFHDMKIVASIESIEQVREIVRNEELKTFRRLTKPSFSIIRLIETDGVILFKGDEYAVYVSQYIGENNIELRVENNKLFLHLSDWSNWRSMNTPILISMPTEPHLIYSWSEDGNSMNHRVFGFEGGSTYFYYKRVFAHLNTDMSYINIKQEYGSLTLWLLGNNVQVNADVENSSFRLLDRHSDSINLNMRLQESIGSFDIHSRSNAGTLSVTGTLNEHQWLWYRERRSTFQYPGQADSLIIQLVNNMQSTEILYLTTNLSGRYENIDISGNIFIERRNDLKWRRNRCR